jgi:hypothetical protein
LLSKYVDDGAGRMAMLELGSEWMGKKIVLCAFFVFFQGSIENELEVERRWASRENMRHGSLFM